MSHSVTLHNTLSGTRETFVPADPARVTLYVCGPTVYHHAHVGNFRPVVVFDLLFRLLRYHYGEDHVIFARNITDIDDKIIQAAHDQSLSITAITDLYTDIYRRESNALGALSPTLEPRATDHITQMIALIGTLLDKGAAYSAENHILFDIDQYDAYGSLSKVNRDDMLAGARVEVAPYKRNPADFVLWKPAKSGEPGWSTPAHFNVDRQGRPGWHLECSAMIASTLGTTIDIHGGGQDLRFPHHENECAQSGCAHGAPLARYWMHNGFLSMPSGKMSKSVGNVILVRDLLQQWPGEVIRFALMSAHYRQPLEWNDTLLSQSKAQLDRFYRALADHDYCEDTPPDSGFVEALNDDLNLPSAMARLHALRDAGNIKALRASAKLIGLLTQHPDVWFKSASPQRADGPTDDEIDLLITQRQAAKKAKDYGKADTIREKLKAAGIIIEDGANGTTWRRQ
ncbi:MAG: cysteine--tRNA ligase [Pseudomonadota bacterium]